MSEVFKAAKKQNVKARIALYGPSKAGKTYTALCIAAGLGGRVALIDAENGSASLYADEFEFDTAGMYEPFHPGRYAWAINTAVEEGYDVVIVDGISPAWSGPGGVLEISEKNQKSGNKWSGWAVATPAHHELVGAILACRAHLICTMRSNTEWAVGEKNKPERIGLKPDQGKNIEYEFHFLCEIDHTHAMRVEARGEFAGTSVEPGRDAAVAFGRGVGEWLTKDAVTLSTPEQNARIVELGTLLTAATDRATAEDAYREERAKAGDPREALQESQAAVMIAALEKRLEDSADTPPADRVTVVAPGSDGPRVPTPPVAPITKKQRDHLAKLREQLFEFSGKTDEAWYGILADEGAKTLDDLDGAAARRVEHAVNAAISKTEFVVPAAVQQKLAAS